MLPDEEEKNDPIFPVTCDANSDEISREEREVDETEERRHQLAVMLLQLFAVKFFGSEEKVRG